MLLVQGANPGPKSREGNTQEKTLMIEVADASINSFALGTPDPDLLQEVLSELCSLRGEVANLKDENATLRTEVKQLREERKQDHIKFIALQNDLKKYHVWTNTGKVDDLMEWADEVDKKLDHLEGIRKPGKKQEARLRKLDQLLVLRNNEAITFSEIGKLLELGHRDEKKNTRPQAMTKFGKVLEGLEDHYEITDSKVMKGSKLVKLTRNYYLHARKDFLGV